MRKLSTFFLKYTRLTLQSKIGLLDFEANSLMSFWTLWKMYTISPTHWRNQEQTAHHTLVSTALDLTDGVKTHYVTPNSSNAATNSHAGSVLGNCVVKMKRPTLHFLILLLLGAYVWAPKNRNELFTMNWWSVEHWDLSSRDFALTNVTKCTGMEAGKHRE